MMLPIPHRQHQSNSAMSIEPHDSLESLLEYARSSSWRGSLPAPTHRLRQRNPLCGDEVTLEVAVTGDEVVQDIRFQAKGCLLCQAGASLLCEQVARRSLRELRSRPLAELLGMDFSQLSTSRRSCALLACEAFSRLLKVSISKQQDLV
jgi:nitrogen fixation NifU-like protein